MKFIFLLSISTCLLMPTFSTAQNFFEHRWENRLVLVLAEGENNTPANKQIELLTADQPGLTERKIIIYLIDRQGIVRVSEENKAVEFDPKFYEKYKQTNTDFEIVLIGLDGGEKLRQSAVLTREKLYTLIDGMPMRRAEMNRNTQIDK